MSDPVRKTDGERRAELTPEQYQVTRRKGTERAFTGAYWDCKEDGVYRRFCMNSRALDLEMKGR